MQTLFQYRRNGFSQNGEEGIIAHIFDVIGVGTKMCCEFGAWDGIHLSNTRSLILDGWSGLLIEGDAKRFNDLLSTYKANDIAIGKVGQPLPVFVRRGRELGYRLICVLLCNAFFLQDDEGVRSDLPEVTALDAWQSAIELYNQSRFHAEWLFRYNLGLSYAKYKFDNEFLSAENLGIQPERGHWLATAPLTDDLRYSWRIAERRQLRRLLGISKVSHIKTG